MRPSSENDDTSPHNNQHNDSFRFDIPDEEIYFPKQKRDSIGDNYYCCICFVDMVNSTKITSQIADANKIRRYYSIFLNSMATMAKNFGSKVIKNVGDALIFYFPDTSSPENRTAFKEVLECCTAIIAVREFINRKLDLELLPDVSYRISADYGKVEVGTSVNSGKEDLFGPTVSICAKINPKAESNGIVIGGDLYEVLKRFSFDQEYEFKEVKAWSIGMRYSYPVYSVRRKDRLLFEDSMVLNLFKRTTREGEAGSTSPGIQQKQKESYRVMIVDDESDVLAVFKSFLISEGFNVEAFSDAYKALVAFSRSEPLHYDLIILDIRMPSMNGLQLYQRVKAIDPRVKVIFLSALEATEELVSILEGVSSVDVLRKPIDKKHFIQKVKSSITA